MDYRRSTFCAVLLGCLAWAGLISAADSPVWGSNWNLVVTTSTTSLFPAGTLFKFHANSSYEYGGPYFPVGINNTEVAHYSAFNAYGGWVLQNTSGYFAIGYSSAGLYIYYSGPNPGNVVLDWVAAAEVPPPDPLTNDIPLTACQILSGNPDWPFFFSDTFNQWWYLAGGDSRIQCNKLRVLVADHEFWVHAYDKSGKKIDALMHPGDLYFQQDTITPPPEPPPQFTNSTPITNLPPLPSSATNLDYTSAFEKLRIAITGSVGFLSSGIHSDFLVGNSNLTAGVSWLGKLSDSVLQLKDLITGSNVTPSSVSETNDFSFSSTGDTFQVDGDSGYSNSTNLMNTGFICYSNSLMHILSTNSSVSSVLSNKLSGLAWPSSLPDVRSHTFVWDFTQDKSSLTPARISIPTGSTGHKTFSAVWSFTINWDDFPNVIYIRLALLLGLLVCAYLEMIGIIGREV